jgi:2-hydroxy-3-keto-5-methylthiopentenyl-1-phosphate phosphatase
MKMVFTATKSGYGPAFEGVFNSLEELKRGIVESSNGTDYYTEELFKECITQDRFDIYAVDLHDDEEIVFHHVYANEEYHTDSWFTIEKKDKSRFSVCFKLKLDI